MRDSMSDHKDHWEALFDKNYLRWFHLQGQDCVVEISKVEPRVEMTLRGGIKTKKPVVWFKGKEKPLVLNVTNANSIADMLGPKPSKWIGGRVCLYTTTTKMYDDGLKKMVERDCIRIKEAK